MKDVLNIGTYWYDNSIDKTNGEFDCVLQHRENFSVYEVKCYKNKVDENTVAKEIEQVTKSKLNINKVGFVSLNGFEFENQKFDLISGDDLFEFED